MVYLNDVAMEAFSGLAQDKHKTAQRQNLKCSRANSSSAHSMRDIHDALTTSLPWPPHMLFCCRKTLQIMFRAFFALSPHPRRHWTRNVAYVLHNDVHSGQVASNLWHSFDSFGGAWYSRRPHELRFCRSPSQRLQTHLTICKGPQGIENVQQPLMSCPPLRVLTSCVTAQWLGCRVYHRNQHVGRFRRPNWWRTR